MKLKDFDYDLPKNLIAQKPIRPRDHSRLLVIRRGSTNSAHANENKNSCKIEHKYFYDIIDYLNKGDVLVLNNTKVMPARLIGKKVVTGGRVEVFLLRKNPPNPPAPLSRAGQALYQGGIGGKTPLYPPLSGGRSDVWQCLVGGKKRKENLRVEFAGGLKAEIIKNNNDGTWNVKFNKSGASFMKIVKKVGRVPLPPYISSTRSEQVSRKQYQTIYADNRKSGSVAAPTAGFHFTKNLINQLKKKGVQFEEVTLRVGLGTFAPVKVDDVTKHKMHEEWIEAKASAIKRIQTAKLEGRRIIAVGTTSVRTLEALAKFSIFNFQFSNNFQTNKFSKKTEQQKVLRDYSGWTDIFIYPGYKFKAVDAMITNFHLPKSTLLMLVSALVGRDKIFNAYREAIKSKYRFYSYGDAMLII